MNLRWATLSFWYEVVPPRPLSPPPTSSLASKCKISVHYLEWFWTCNFCCFRVGKFLFSFVAECYGIEPLPQATAMHFTPIGHFTCHVIFRLSVGYLLHGDCRHSFCKLILGIICQVTIAFYTSSAIHLSRTNKTGKAFLICARKIYFSKRTQV